MQPVEPLRLAVQAAAQGALQALVLGLQLAQGLIARCADQLGSGGRRGCAQVGDEIGDAEIGLVPHPADHRHRAGGDGAGQGLVVEGPQILDRAAAAHQQDDVDGRRAVQCQIGCWRFTSLREQIQLL